MYNTDKEFFTSFSVTANINCVSHSTPKKSENVSYVFCPHNAIEFENVTITGFVFEDSAWKIRR